MDFSKDLHIAGKAFTHLAGWSAYITGVETQASAMTSLAQIDSQGQSATAKAFVARREAADRAIAAAAAYRAEQQAQARAQMQERVGESPMMLMVGIVLTVIALSIGFWWYLGTAQCDPMISDRAYSAECRMNH